MLQEKIKQSKEREEMAQGMEEMYREDHSGTVTFEQT